MEDIKEKEVKNGNLIQGNKTTKDKRLAGAFY